MAQPPQERHQLIADVGDVSANTCLDLDHRQQKLAVNAFETFLGAGVEDAQGARRQLARGGVKNLKL